MVFYQLIVFRFREKYHPQESKPFLEEVRQRRRELLKDFSSKLAAGDLDSVSFDEHSKISNRRDSQQIESSHTENQESITEQVNTKKDIEEEKNIQDQSPQTIINVDQTTLHANESEVSLKRDSATSQSDLVDPNVLFIRGVKEDTTRSQIIQVLKQFLY